MSPARICLQLLVLLSLWFVQITGAAHPLWLAGMGSLALVAPLLLRFARGFAYRLLWNAAVLAIFGILIHDAVEEGVHHLLEDGLILAAFCQVHLLNNLTERQKPDLLYFNSFLIALVTSFFCQDVEFILVFLPYALVLICSLQLGQLPLDARITALPMLRDAAWRGAIVLGGTALVFAFWPRDFHRDGLIDEQLALARAIATSTGFSEDVRLGGEGKLVPSTRIAMRVQVDSGDRELIPAHWRGATFVRYEEDGWKATTQLQRLLRSPSVDPPWLPRRSGMWLRNDRGGGTSVTVELLGPARRLFLPLHASRIETLPPTDPVLIATLLDGTLRYDLLGAPRGDESACRYRATTGVEPRTLGGPVPPNVDRRLLLHVYTPPHLVPGKLRELTRQWLAELPPERDQHEIVEHLRRRIAGEFDYLLPGEPGAARDLEDFLAGAAGGHCEYFATALALMLRTLGIPCRFATGYLATEWADGMLVARDKDAHAWVEVHDPSAGWYVVDPTPARATPEESAADSLWAPVQAELAELWRAVTTFDAKTKDRLLDALLASPAAALRFTIRHPQWLVAIALAAGWWFLRSRRCVRIPRAVRGYERAVRRLGVLRMAHETPREFLHRTQPRFGAHPAWLALAEVTEQHERQRYGAKRPAPPQFNST